VGVYLACGISRSADFWSSLCIWANQPKNELVTHLFGRQAIPMAWDHAEANPFSNSGGNFIKNMSYVAMGIDFLPGAAGGFASQHDAQTNDVSTGKVISTDPPYYDNIGYADLSDYFYVWLRRSLRQVFPEVFSTLAVPKAEELVATPYRHGGREQAEQFFLDGMTHAMRRLANQAHPGFPVTIYYAFKQSESDGDSGTTNTGWDTFLAAVIEAGFGISGTWPVRTERQGRMIGNDTNSLASSIVLVCRQRVATAPTATRREFVAALKTELPTALRHLQEGNIAPVDLAQAAIGPGMAVYTRYSKVIDAQGNPVSVREALTLINQVLDETLAEQEGDFDTDSRFALAWFEQHGFDEGEFGVANVLAQAKNTGMNGLVESGILASSRGRVRLLRADELPEDWDPATDPRLTAWEVVHQLIRVLGSGGEPAAAELLVKLGARAEPARELCYRLYTLCERKKRAADALSYNALVQSWPEMLRLAADPGRSSGGRSAGPDGDLFDQ
jgi:putative DNA methylase